VFRHRYSAPPSWRSPLASKAPRARRSAVQAQLGGLADEAERIGRFLGLEPVLSLA
jgi:hypothetical protein